MLKANTNVDADAMEDLYANLRGPLKYTLTNDYMFKAFLQRNEKVLKGLLCALLGFKATDISSVVIINPIEIGDTVGDKTIVMDIRLILNNEQIINIEMQVENLGDWPERSLMYLCRNYDQLERGGNYIDSMRVVHIGILNFTPEGFPHKLYLKYNFVNQENNHIYSDKLTIFMLQLNQLGSTDDEANMPELYTYAQLFRATTWEEIVMLAKKNDSIREGIVTLKELSDDEKLQLECEARERHRRDLDSAKRYGEKQGIEQGIEQGRITLIHTLREFSIPDAQILPKLMDKYHMTMEEAEEQLRIYG